MWYWQYSIAASGIPVGRESAVQDALAEVLPLRIRESGQGWLVSHGGDALPTATDPRTAALELTRAAWSAAGERCAVHVWFAPFDTCDEAGNSLDDEPLHVFAFDAAAVEDVLRPRRRRRASRAARPTA